MDLGLRDRVAIVAASSQGLGKAVAQGRAREGAKPKVSGHEAADALDIALEITRMIELADPRPPELRGGITLA